MRLPLSSISTRLSAPPVPDAAPHREALGEHALRPHHHEHDERDAVDDELDEARLAGSMWIARRSTGSSSTTTAAPRTEPVRLAMPPKITMAKIVSENAKPNTLGVASPSQPE